MDHTGGNAELADLRAELASLAGVLNAYQLRVVLAFARSLFLE